MEDEGDLLESEQRQRRQGGGGGEEEEEQVVYCAVGKEAGREWKANLLWVLANLRRRKRLVFLHLHRPASRINMMGAWVPVSQLAEQEVTAYRQLEEGKIGKVLDELLDICKSQKVNASKVIVASDDTAKGLVQFVDDHGVTELVMGAASDRAYHRKMRAPRSKKALIVQRRANPSCKIWFVCKGNLICTREGEASEGPHRTESSTTASTSPRSGVSDYSRSKSSPRLHGETFSTQESNEPTTFSVDRTLENAMDRHMEDSNRQAITAGSSYKPSTSETVGPEEEPPAGVQLQREVEDDPQGQGVPSPDGSEDDGEMDDALYEKLKDAVMEAENLKREAYEETRRRQMAERDLSEANRMADEAERSYQREARQRKEVEETLAREREEMERDRRELDGMLEQIRKADVRSAELEVQIASSERAMSGLEARLSESYGVLDALRRQGAVESEDEAAAADEEINDISEEEEEEEEEADDGFRRFGYAELEEATNRFDEALRIDGGGGGSSNGGGGGRRGKVYRGELRDDTAVAVKVFRADVAVDEARFAREAEAIGRVTRRHPGLVKMVGACPAARAVVYELVPPGGRTLEEHLLEGHLPWHVRCGVAYRTCAALSSLHSTTPRPTVHGDVRPGNILLVLGQQEHSNSKLGGLGTRRLVKAEHRHLATGELTPRGDVYSLGVVLLRLVTGRPAFLARKAAQEAAAGIKAWREAVDDAGGWPVQRAAEVALVALKCCSSDTTTRKGRSSGELLDEVRSVLEDAVTAAPGRSPSALSDESAPSYFLCPILKEVMTDPHIAGDGFSYEAEAIREWLDGGHDTSPMTNLRLPTRHLTPNHALRSAIHQWRHRRQGHAHFIDH